MGAMKPRVLLLALLPMLATPMVVAQDLVSLGVYVEALGRGTAGTVVGVTIEIAREDWGLVGNRVRVTASLLRHGEVVDTIDAETILTSDGSATLYREWVPGNYELHVTVASLTRAAFGLSAGEVEVPAIDDPFELAVGRPAGDMAPDLTPPRTGAVRFEPGSGLDSALQVYLTVSAPEGTASVEFWLGPTLFERRKRPPWTIAIPLEEIVGRTLVKAVARDSRRRYLGEDAMRLNNPTNELGIEILLAPKETIEKSVRQVTLAVTGGEEIHELDLFLDDKIVARWEKCPCVTEIAVAELEKASILSAEVMDARGARANAVRILAEGFGASVRVDMVELPVQVFDTHDAPVTGLKKEDFSVFEDKRKMEIEDIGTSHDTPLSLVIAVDTSGSMTEVFPEVRRAVSGFAEHLLEGDDRVALVRFSIESELMVAWTNEPSTLARSLSRVVPWGPTAIYDAVVLSLMQFESPRSRQAMVLLTDGVDNTSYSRIEYVKNFTRTMRVPIFPIGLGIDNPNIIRNPRISSRKVLKTLAKETGGMAFFPKNVDELPAIYEEISELLRSQYVLWYRPDPDKSAKKYRSIKVKVNNPSLHVRTIRGYYPGK